MFHSSELSNRISSPFSPKKRTERGRKDTGRHSGFSILRRCLSFLPFFCPLRFEKYFCLTMPAWFVLLYQFFRKIVTCLLSHFEDYQLQKVIYFCILLRKFKVKINSKLEEFKSEAANWNNYRLVCDSWIKTSLCCGVLGFFFLKTMCFTLQTKLKMKWHLAFLAILWNPDSSTFACLTVQYCILSSFHEPEGTVLLSET